MNFRLLVTAPLLLTGAVLLTACGAARPITYYSLDPPEVAPAPQRLDVALLVGHIGAPLVYRDSRIIYRTGPNALGVYEEHRWAEPPAAMFEEMLLATLRQSHRYRSVQLVTSNARGDYVLRGRVERFEQVEGSPSSGRVWLHLYLYDPKEGHNVWNASYEHDEAAAANDFPSIVAALNHNLQSGVLELTAGLDQYLSAHPVPAAK